MALLRLMLTWRHLMSNKKIYESPDGGKTVYERDFGAPHTERTLIVGNDDYMTDTLSVDLSNHLDEMGIIDTYTKSASTITVDTDWQNDWQTMQGSSVGRKKLPRSLYKKYGL